MRGNLDLESKSHTCIRLLPEELIKKQRGLKLFFFSFYLICRTIFLVLLFSQYARNVQFPLPVYKAKKGWTSYRLQVFKMFPVSTKAQLLFLFCPFFSVNILGCYPPTTTSASFVYPSPSCIMQLISSRSPWVVKRLYLRTLLCW